ncbi:NAD(P)-dependent alcohol dehydrogenase [Phytomonospora endophytica]|uniref:NADPH:quinone reductase-like Zn-dependent oxidoreductase n=1 Tax=Phytomonospora endophytica TaxID=714109 RepID=A0A841FMF3_9ACTN|nr:NAD(P)-dependent alcohol dehydrogenase [Phytomonospora endophytica]MBB6033789.1 NADPH:quinone reductase-like Zn-dependent oxidoreductase [Phytomonospora endophytica]GIG64693.1 dehydrogenase [Phytomonospora endophytica]
MAMMRAAFYDSYGPPEVIYVGRAPVPTPRKGQVLVRVGAASVNGGELFARAGRLRLLTGRRFPKAVGIDFAGRIEALGPGVRGVGAGEDVWGVLPRGRMGTAAEFVAVDAGRVAPIPAGLDAIEAVSLLAGGTTALTGLRDKAALRGGERLLVRGAAGGVGSLAVQLGKVFGAHVTGLASARTGDFVRGLGADEVLDYAVTGPGDLGRFDVVFDTVGGRLPEFRRLLAPGGRMVAVAFDASRILRDVGYLFASVVHGSRRVRFFSGDPRRELLDELAVLVGDGSIRPVVDTVRPLSEVAVAHRALEDGGVRGKQVIAI